MEILSLSIKNTREIEGLRIGNDEKKLTQFADDTSLFLQPTKKTLRRTLLTLNNFKEVSGLKINLSKTKAIWIGSNRYKQNGICYDLGLDWVHEFVALGIKYNVQDLNNIIPLNCTDKLVEIDRSLANWNRRNLILLGRVTVVKSLALSRIVIFFIALPTPDKNFMRAIKKKFYGFIW